jgi:ATP synthase protein I
MTRPGGDERGEDKGGEKQAPESVGEAYRKAAPYMGAATSLVGAVAGFTLLGYWIDRKVGDRTPWFTLAGAVLGMVGGFVSFFRQVLGKGTQR